MTTYYSQELTARNGHVEDKLNGVTRGGKKRVKISTYEASATASGSLIEMDFLPKGARLLSGKLVTDALGSGVTITVGDGTTAARFLAATTCNTANLNTPLTPGIAEIESGLTAETKLILTVGGAAATGTIMLEVEYIEEQD